jgi:hypothetical protein
MHGITLTVHACSASGGTPHFSVPVTLAHVKIQTWKSKYSGISTRWLPSYNLRIFPQVPSAVWITNLIQVYNMITADNLVCNLSDMVS